MCQKRRSAEVGEIPHLSHRSRRARGESSEGESWSRLTDESVEGGELCFASFNYEDELTHINQIWVRVDGYDEARSKEAGGDEGRRRGW